MRLSPIFLVICGCWPYIGPYADVEQDPYSLGEDDPGTSGFPDVNNSNPDSDADTDADADSDADADTDSDADADADADVDTGLTATVVGDATIDSSTYTGTETWEFDGVRTGATICDITYDAIDWGQSSGTGPDPYDTPCTGPDGTDCDFYFTVYIDGAHETGGDCSLFDVTGSWSDMGPSGYGFLDEYTYNGYVYAENVLMYYIDYTGSPYFGSWIAIADATFNGSNFHYEIELGAL